ncbi:lactonase family protein [Pseudoduganella armeniaca]|uniref:Beta-propeller fold lactonase family protein n=1 Tax=Pseudoduganella armeniaca TaxID=2072590 RepID=A0A2R4CHA7_9BURK|nr:lactonase family protein [Pseudoduganella armeniaca]AVR98912.1 hypothetical protein C9I28_27295 [Pseudoduganella armeniaca]
MQDRRPDGFTLLVGCYSSPTGDGGGIRIFRFEPPGGAQRPPRITSLGWDVSARNASYLVASGDGRYVYAVDEQGGGRGGVCAYAFDQAASRLRPIGRMATAGDFPCHLVLSADGSHVFVANYGSEQAGGSGIAAYRRRPDNGALSGGGMAISYAYPSHAHAIVPSPDAGYVFVPDLGRDRVRRYRFAPTGDDVVLREAGVAAVTPNAGPRHLLFTPDGRHAFLVAEAAEQVVAYRYENGMLIRRATLPLSNHGTARGAGAALALSPDGRFLYVSNRGHLNQIAIFEIDADGHPRARGQVSCEGVHPRDLLVTPCGAWLLVANQHSDEVVCFTRHADHGGLQPSGERLAVRAPARLLAIGC